MEHVGDMRFFLDADHWSPFNRVQAGELSQVEQSRQVSFSPRIWRMEYKTTGCSVALTPAQ